MPKYHYRTASSAQMYSTMYYYPLSSLPYSALFAPALGMKTENWGAAAGCALPPPGPPPGIAPPTGPGMNMGGGGPATCPVSLGAAPRDFAFVWKLEGPRFGGAIMAASGSFAGTADEAAGADAVGVDMACGVVGGGPTGFAFSSGSSPGNTQLITKPGKGGGRDQQHVSDRNNPKMITTR